MNYDIIAVRRYCEHNLHLVQNQDETLCGKKIGLVSMNYTEIPRNKRICKDCLAKVGDEMLPEYVGYDRIK